MKRHLIGMIGGIVMAIIGFMILPWQTWITGHAIRSYAPGVEIAGTTIAFVIILVGIIVFYHSRKIRLAQKSIEEVKH